MKNRTLPQHICAHPEGYLIRMKRGDLIEAIKTGTEPVLAAEIELVAHRILALYEQQRCYLVDKPTDVLEELRHRCEEASMHESFSVRTGAEIVLLEARVLKFKKGAQR